MPTKSEYARYGCDLEIPGQRTVPRWRSASGPTRRRPDRRFLPAAGCGFRRKTSSFACLIDLQTARGLMETRRRDARPGAIRRDRLPCGAGSNEVNHFPGHRRHRAVILFQHRPERAPFFSHGFPDWSQLGFIHLAERVTCVAVNCGNGNPCFVAHRSGGLGNHHSESVALFARGLA